MHVIISLNINSRYILVGWLNIKILVSSANSFTVFEGNAFKISITYIRTRAPSSG